jgi:hypothetical protein
MVIAVCCWLIGGVFLDTWAHSNLAILDTFFTPWHAVLYSGGAAVTVALVGPLLWYRRHGYAWLTAMPAGYELSLLGAGLFALGGLGDLTWHVLFGIERNVDAVLSPTHLLLAFAIALIVSGPLRAAWLRPDSLMPAGWAARLPMLISLGFVLTMTTLLTMYANPFSNRIVTEPAQS